VQFRQGGGQDRAAEAFRSADPHCAGDGVGLGHPGGRVHGGLGLQSDLKKLVAYSSVSHMGFCLLGMAALTPLGMVGASMQMFSHGMITAMLFFLVGVVYDRAHHRQIDGFGGLGVVVTVYTAFIGFAFFASLGLPGMSGFIAEQMVFLGSFQVFRTLAEKVDAIVADIMAANLAKINGMEIPPDQDGEAPEALDGAEPVEPQKPKKRGKSAEKGD